MATVSFRRLKVLEDVYAAESWLRDHAHECQLFPPLRWCSERNDD